MDFKLLDSFFRPRFASLAFFLPNIREIYIFFGSIHHLYSCIEFLFPLSYPFPSFPLCVASEVKDKSTVMIFLANNHINKTQDSKRKKERYRGYWTSKIYCRCFCL